MPRVNVKDKRKQQLIDANMMSIARRGLVDTTIAHVSDGANMSRGIVNFYFTSKEKMMQETLSFLMGEQLACWQAALQSAPQEPVAKIDAMARALMGDKLCSVRRLAVLNAFVGHAGTHACYAKIIRAADDAFIQQVKLLWQQAGYSAKEAEVRAKQVLAIIRGHHTMAFLNIDSGKPSVFISAWSQWLMGQSAAKAEPFAAAPTATVEKSAVPTLPASLKPKKVAPRSAVRQMDIADLFD